jgi:preprotein translocase subunit SecG
MLFNFLLVLQTLIAAAMVGVILMQRSEGGGLGVGGSPSGLMSARGAADFLTRATAILAVLFVVLSIVLAGLATVERAPVKIDPSLARPAAPAAPVVPGAAPGVAPGAAPAVDPLAGAAQQAAGQPAAPSNSAAPPAK